MIETIGALAGVVSVILGIVQIRDNRLRNPLPQQPARHTSPPPHQRGSPPSWLGTRWAAVVAGIVAVLVYSAILANTIDGNSTARVVISVATLAVVVVVWLARRGGSAQPSRLVNWLMIVLIVGPIGALPLP